MGSIQRQLAFLEMEEKAQKRRLHQFAQILRERELEHGKDYVEPPDKFLELNAQRKEKIELMDELRKERFQDDKKAIELMKELRKPLKKAEQADVDAYQSEPREISKKMYPVDPETLVKLYEGISHYDEGRKLYLKLRNRLSPCSKYVYSPTFGWDYGWCTEERPTASSKEFARTELIRRTFYRRSGIKGECLSNRPALPVGLVSGERL